MFGSAELGGNLGQALVWGGIAAVVGLMLTVLAVLVPAWRDARAITVREARVDVGVVRRPLWSRLYLDVLCLVASALLFWQAVRSGYQVVLAPEGVPTISVSYLTFLAPLLLWVGATLFGVVG